MRARKRMVIYFAAFLGGYLGLCYFLAGSYLSPARRVAVRGSDVEEVEVPSAAGPVPTWATPGIGHGKALFVLAHGYGGNRETWAWLMPELHKRGFDVVAPSMPGQDASPDATVGFGRKEAQTIADAVAWARTHYASPPKVVLVGVSMGGAATWLATERVPDVHAVATEGAYARFDVAMTGWFERMFRGASVVFRPVIWFATAKSKLNPGDIRPIDAAQAWRGRPALVIQGSEDTLIPMFHAKQLAEASGGELWVVKGATHAMCQDVAGREYVDRLASLANEDSASASATARSASKRR